MIHIIRNRLLTIHFNISFSKDTAEEDNNDEAPIEVEKETKKATLEVVSFPTFLF